MKQFAQYYGILIQVLDTCYMFIYTNVELWTLGFEKVKKAEQHLIQNSATLSISKNGLCRRRNLNMADKQMHFQNGIKAVTQ